MACAAVVAGIDSRGRRRVESPCFLLRPCSLAATRSNADAVPTARRCRSLFAARRSPLSQRHAETKLPGRADFCLSPRSVMSSRRRVVPPIDPLTSHLAHVPRSDLLAPPLSLHHHDRSSPLPPSAPIPLLHLLEDGPERYELGKNLQLSRMRVQHIKIHS
ncbi:hypothetical protein EYF80_048431 [Liparis tanakae]|uniref:Uncharacterized protein n=1 Tax=Liparis tanakae TaxID=230148 RepID=A0A4Z2FKV8_9TELE|nr:hypothetical protein EYF80_048431 [Liparis tanakae]